MLWLIVVVTGSKFSSTTDIAVGAFMKYHKFFNLVSVSLIITGVSLSFSKFKEMINTENLIKATFTFFVIYVYTVLYDFMY